MFAESYMLYGSNRSPNNIGLTIVGYLYQKGMEQNNLGFGSGRNYLTTTVFCLLLTSMVGYGLVVYNFKGKNIIFGLVLIVMIISVEIIMLPLYKLTMNLGLMDTLVGAFLPFIVASIPIFFVRQYASGLPKDLLDAARVDGCTEIGIFSRDDAINDTSIFLNGYSTSIG